MFEPDGDLTTEWLLELWEAGPKPPEGITSPRGDGRQAASLFATQTTARNAHLDADPLLRAPNLIGERIERSMNPPAATLSGETRRS